MLPPEVEHFVGIDFHDGLRPNGQEETPEGPIARSTFLVEYVKDSPEYKLLESWYGTGRVDSAREAGTISTAPAGSGAVDNAMLRQARLIAPKCKVLVGCLEISTYPLLEVAWQMRLRHWLTNHGSLDSGLGQSILKRTKRIFYPKNKLWRYDLRRCAKEVIMQTLKGFRSPWGVAGT